MTPQILLDAESNFNNFIPAIKELQRTYYENNGHYWQGLWTHVDPPSDDNGEQPDNLDSNPHDQEISWNDVIASSDLISNAFPDTMILRISIDVYSSPSEQGYIVSLQKTVEESLWEKSICLEGSAETEDDWHITTQ